MLIHWTVVLIISRRMVLPHDVGYSVHFSGEGHTRQLCGVNVLGCGHRDWLLCASACCMMCGAGFLMPMTSHLFHLCLGSLATYKDCEYLNHGCMHTRPPPPTHTHTQHIVYTPHHTKHIHMLLYIHCTKCMIS